MKRHRDLDTGLSWAIIDEVNKFGWLGFGRRPVPHLPNSFAYGFLPTRLFDQFMMKITAVWNQREGGATP